MNDPVISTYPTQSFCPFDIDFIGINKARVTANPTFQNLKQITSQAPEFSLVTHRQLQKLHTDTNILEDNQKRLCVEVNRAAPLLPNESLPLLPNCFRLFSMTHLQVHAVRPLTQIDALKQFETADTEPVEDADIHMLANDFFYPQVQLAASTGDGEPPFFLWLRKFEDLAQAQ